MVTSTAQKKAVMKWRKENYADITLSVKKERKQEIKAAAGAAGLSVTQYINNAITEYMKRHPISHD